MKISNLNESQNSSYSKAHKTAKLIERDISALWRDIEDLKKLIESAIKEESNLGDGGSSAHFTKKLIELHSRDVEELKEQLESLIELSRKISRAF